jgi:hypothetical protein
MLPNLQKNSCGEERGSGEGGRKLNDSVGKPRGTCGSYGEHEACHTPTALKVVQSHCVGLSSCTFLYVNGKKGEGESREEREGRGERNERTNNHAELMRMYLALHHVLLILSRDFMCRYEKK